MQQARDCFKLQATINSIDYEGRVLKSMQQ